jgi:hypothetical protein
MLGLALESHFSAAATSRFGCCGSAMEAQVAQRYSSPR